jgi:hypothetical protein
MQKPTKQISREKVQKYFKTNTKDKKLVEGFKKGLEDLKKGKEKEFTKGSLID